MVTREQILDIIKGHLMDNLEDFDAMDFEPTKSMREMGANDFDIVEVVTCTQRELKSRVSQITIRKVASVQEFADLIYDYLENRRVSRVGVLDL